MNLHGEFAISCDLCDQLVPSVDVRPRRSARLCRNRESDALLCPRCVWTVDHIRPRIGLLYGN